MTAPEGSFSTTIVYIPEACRWQTTALPDTAVPVDPVQALAWLQRESDNPLKAPVGIIGPNEATEEQIAVAAMAGAIIGRMGLALRAVAGRV